MIIHLKLTILMLLATVHSTNCLYCGERAKFINVTTLPWQGCKSYNSTRSTCSSLEEAFKPFRNLSDTCVYVDVPEISLNATLKLSAVRGFTLKANGSVVNCDQNQNNTGIFVSDSIDVKILSINIYTCGNKAFNLGLKKNISSSVHVRNVSRLTVDEVDMSICRYHCMAAENLHGNNTFNRLYFSQPMIDNVIRSMVLFTLTEKQKTSIFFSNSDFMHNNMPKRMCDTFNNISKTTKNVERLNPDGKGGAVALFLLNTTQNKLISFNNCLMGSNNAAFGGAVYLLLEQNVSHNRIKFRDTQMYQNKAYTGGAIYILDTAVSNTNHIGLLHSCSVNSNKACIGGAMMILQLNGRTKIRVVGVSFCMNRAVLGSTIQADHTKFEFRDVKIQKGNIPEDIYSGQGSVYLTNSELTCHGSVHFHLNNNTALVLDFSQLKVKGNVTFEKNKGNLGGGVSLYGQSVISMHGPAELRFLSNKAKKQGGAMYVLIPGPTLRPWLTTRYRIYPCFFHRSKFNGSVTFSDNQALTRASGNDIFASTLKTCKKNSTEHEAAIITKWPHFFLNYTFSDSCINTNAVNSSVDEEEWSVQPGRIINASLILLDERGTQVDEPVSIFLSNATNAQFENRRYIVQNGRVLVRLYSSPNINYTVFVQSASSLRSFVMRVPECLFFYFYNATTLMCQCNKKKTAYCDNDEMYLLTEKWGRANHLYDCPEGYCKQCSADDAFIGGLCRFDERHQCAENRTQNSRLCARCKKGYSTLIGSNMCVDCRSRSKLKSWLLIIVVAFIAFPFIIFGPVVYFPGSVGYLVSTIYFYQICDIFDFKCKTYIPTTILSSLWVGDSNRRCFEFCIFNNMDDLCKRLAILVFYVVWSLMMVVYQVLITKCIGPRLFPARVTRTNRNRERVFVVVSHLVHSNLMRVALETFRWITIHAENGVSHKYVYYFAEEQWLKTSRHIVMFLVMLIVASFFACFQTLLCISSVYRNRPQFYKQPIMFATKLWQWLKSVKWRRSEQQDALLPREQQEDEQQQQHELQQQLQQPQQQQEEELPPHWSELRNSAVQEIFKIYQRNRMYVGSYFFWARSVVFFSFYTSPAEIRIAVVAICCLVNVFSFSLLKPHREDEDEISVNERREYYYNLSLLTLLLIIAMLLNSFQWMYLSDKDTFYWILELLILLPAVGLFASGVHWKVTKLKADRVMAPDEYPILN